MMHAKTSELSKSAKETGNICDRLWHLLRRGYKANFQLAQLALKTTQILHKNKA